MKTEVNKILNFYYGSLHEQEDLPLPNTSTSTVPLKTAEGLGH